MKSELVIPMSVLLQHAIILGKTGKGKSSLLRYLVEHLSKQNKRVVIIDPKGDWWGILVGADGKSSGFPYILFGDFKDGGVSDVPINEHSGKQLAELITKGNRPCVIGMRGWMPAQMMKFWVAFAAGVFNQNAGELYIVIDEIQNFAPKERFGIGEENMAVYWSKKLLSEGRGLGVTIFCGSQRPQSVHNGVLTQCETLFGMGLTHDADCSAVELWLKRTRDKTLKEKIMLSLPELAKGEAWVWSPEVKFGPERVQFPFFNTFDSFAPPQLQKRVAASGWNNVDLDEVKAELEKVIEESTANDPAKLRRRIFDLEQQVKQATAKPAGPAPQPATTIKEVPILSVLELDRLQALIDEHERFESIAGKIVSAAESIRTQAELNRLEIQFFKSLLKQKTSPAQHSPVSRHSKNEATAAVGERHPGNQQSHADGVTLGRCERYILTSLAQYPQGRTHNQVAILSGYSSTSGGFKNSLSSLRAAGLITRGQPMMITKAGLAELGEWTPMPTGSMLVNYWIDRLPRCEGLILKTLVECYPNGMHAHDLAAATGYSSDSGGFKNALSKLRTLELIKRGQPIHVSDDFFQ